MSEAILATLVDVKIIRTRSQMQIICEVPIEDADEALRKLGGIPQPGTERWIGLALAPKERKEFIGTYDEAIKHAESGKKPRPFSSLPLSQQAGIRCSDQQFSDYLGLPLIEAQRLLGSDAGAIVRDICGVSSRSELDTNDLAAQKWRKLEADYQAYLTDQRYSGQIK